MKALQPGGALHALTITDSFLIYELRPKAGKPGKMDKVPVAPVRWGTAAELLSAEAAIALCAEWQSEHGHGIGYVFQPGCGFFFLDMDNYWIDGAWDPLVNQMFSRLRGAAFEVSSSRKGCHFFGRHTGLPPHANKNVPLRLELYTENRFVALTGLQAVGDASVDCTDALLGIIADYFPARVSEAPVHAGNGPRDDYHGPADDGELIELACRSGKARSAFGGAATFKHLWECNTAKLANNWPANDDNGDFDRSSADMALASHLAFWTGCDAERIDRLMRVSGLMRDKYERADYMTNTIAKAIAGCTEVFGSRPAVPVEGAEWTNKSTVNFPDRREPIEVATDLMSKDSKFNRAKLDGKVTQMVWLAAVVYPGECDKILAMLMAGGMPDSPELRDLITQVNARLAPAIPIDDEPSVAGLPVVGPTKIEDLPFYGPEQQVALFKGCVIVPMRNAVLTPKGDLMKQEEFNLAMPAGIYALSEQKKVDKPWQALIGSQFMAWPRVDGVEFRPDRPSLSIYHEDGRSYVNSYVPHRLAVRNGDPTPFLNHIIKLIPDDRDRDILLSWMAALAQYPGVKFRWSPVLQGCEGNGKGLICGLLRHVVGRRYTHVAQAADLANKFNGWLEGNLLILINELDFGNDQEKIDTVKPMISDDDVGVQGKGKDQSTAMNFASFFFTTNHVGGVGQAVRGRRYSMFLTPQQHEDDCMAQGMDGDYFQTLTGWIKAGGYEVMAQYLLDYPINEMFNPAGSCVRAPRTSSHNVAVEASKGIAEQAVEDAIAEGMSGFNVPFVSGHALRELLKGMRRENAVSNRKRREFMRSLGYDWHPTLEATGGRSTRRLASFGGERPVIFVKMNHPMFQITDPHKIMDEFEKNNSPFNRQNYAS